MKKTIFKYIWLGLLIAFPISLIIAPADFFDNGPVVCLSRLLLDMECLGCGTTRAIQHLIHLDFESAWNYNKFSFIVFAGISYYYGKYILKIMSEIKNDQTSPA